MFQEKESKQISRMLVIANTAPSFFRWLEKNVAVRRLAENASEEEIVANIRQLSIGESKTDVDLGMAYGYVAALILQRRRKGPLGALPAEAKVFPWAAEIWEFVSRRSVSTSTSIIRPATPPSQESIIATPYKALSNTQSTFIKG